MDPTKTLLITIFTGIIIISFIFVLFMAKNIVIDEKNIKADIIESKMLSGKCFSDNFATFEKEKFTQKKLDECFSYADESILLRTYISEPTDLRVLVQGEYYLMKREEDFNLKKNLCTINSESIFCKEMRYPITYIDEFGTYSLKILTMQIITQ